MGEVRIADDGVQTPAFQPRPRWEFLFVGGPRDGEISPYKRGDCAQQVLGDTMFCYVHKDGLQMVWTEVPEKLRAIQT